MSYQRPAASIDTAEDLPPIERAVHELDSLYGHDAQFVWSLAFNILLRLVDPRVRDAVNRLTKRTTDEGEVIPWTPPTSPSRTA